MKTSSKLRRLQRQRKLRRQRRRFFLTVMIIAILFAHSAFSNNSGGSNKVVPITVRPGDTMWDIALRYKPEGCDVREYMYDIAANNGIKDCNIVSGQTLYVTVNK